MDNKELAIFVKTKKNKDSEEVEFKYQFDLNMKKILTITSISFIVMLV